MNAFLNRVSMTVLVVVILAALPGCGAVKKAKQAADAIDQAKEALQDIAQDEADQGGKSAEQIEAESILAKATEAGPIRYHEITKSDGGTMESDVWMKDGKLLRKVVKDGSGTTILVSRDSVTVWDEAGKSGFTQKLKDPAEAMALAGVMSGNLFTDPSSFIRDGSDVKRLGSQTVAGQDCAVYAARHSWLGSWVEYRVLVSTDLGIVMKSGIEGGGQEGSASYSYEITELSRGSLADSLFAVPAGVQIMDMASLGR